jgi:hypothetical protein
MLLEGMRAVLNEATAIRTFLLIPLTVQTFARNAYGKRRVYRQSDTSEP